jgi:hypothetical protein
MSIRKTVSLDEADWELSPAPEWVEQNEPAWDFAPADEYPVALLLIDEQHDVETQTVFIRSLRRARTISAVQAIGQVELEFDPAAHRLRIHELAVLRKSASGELDRRSVSSKKSFMLRQRENQLEQQMLNGRLSVVHLLEDIRVGDIIELAWSLIPRDPLPGLRFTAYYAFVWGLPVGRAIFTLHRGTQVAPQHKMHTFPEAAEPVHSATAIRDKWTMERTTPLVPEPNTPGNIWPFTLLDISNWETWAEVSTFVSELWEQALTESTDDLSTLVDELRSIESKETAIRKAIIKVQEDVRYLAVDFGHGGGIIPNDAPTVLRRRFGDCKDKSILLVALLRAIGVDAYPFLVATNWRNALFRVRPSMSAFGHVIVTFLHAGKRHFVDPTLLGQGGELADLIPPNYGAGLEVRNGADALIAIPRPPVPEFIITEIITLNRTKGPSTIEQTIVAKGELADSLRAAFTREGHMPFVKSRTEALQRNFPALKLVEGSAEVTDDMKSNSLQLCARYEMPTWGPIGERIPPAMRYGAAGMLILVPSLEGPEQRKTPWEQRPVSVRNTVVVRGKCVSKLKGEKRSVRGPGFDYTCSIEWKKDHAVFDYRWTATAETVSAEDWPTYVKRRVKMSEVIGLNVHTGAQRFQATASAGTIGVVVIISAIAGAMRHSDSNRHSHPAPLDPALRETLDNLRKSTSENRPSPSSSGLNRELDETLECSTQSRKAMDLQKQGLTKEAITLARENVKKWPTRAQAWQSMAIVASMHKEYETADNAFGKWILLTPSDANAQASFGYFLIQSNQLGRAEKVLERAAKSFPTSGMVWINYSECLAKLGKENASREAQAKADEFLTPRERAGLIR